MRRGGRRRRRRRRGRRSRAPTVDGGRRPSPASRSTRRGCDSLLGRVRRPSERVVRLVTVRPLPVARHRRRTPSRPTRTRSAMLVGDPPRSYYGEGRGRRPASDRRLDRVQPPCRPRPTLGIGVRHGGGRRRSRRRRRPARRRLVLVRVPRRPAEVSATLLPLVSGVGRPAKDARFEVNGGASRSCRGQVGVGVDIEALAARPRRAALTRGRRRGRVDAAHAATLSRSSRPRRRRRWASRSASRRYTTTTTPATGRASTTSTRSPTALDGKLVPPGGTFSLQRGGRASARPRRATRRRRRSSTASSCRSSAAASARSARRSSTRCSSRACRSSSGTNHSLLHQPLPEGPRRTVSGAARTSGGRTTRRAGCSIDDRATTAARSRSACTAPTRATRSTYTTGAVHERHAVHGRRGVKDPTLPVGKRVVEDGGVDGRTVVVVRTVT